MAGRPIVQFWYEFASTYSYPAAMAIDAAADQAGVDVVWRPFLLGPLFHAQQGLPDSPFNVVPVKGRYMWQDVTRICRAHGWAFRPPQPFPQHTVLAARLALLGQDESWGRAFSRAVYEASFAAGLPINEPSVLGRLLRSVGQDPEARFAQAAMPETKAALRGQVDEASARGLFGAPSFLVGDEIFWGCDRLHDALDWANRAPTATHI